MHTTRLMDNIRW